MNPFEQHQQDQAGPMGNMQPDLNFLNMADHLGNFEEEEYDSFIEHNINKGVGILKSFLKFIIFLIGIFTLGALLYPYSRFLIDFSRWAHNWTSHLFP